MVGACNPQLAHQALEVTRDIGLFLLATWWYASTPPAAWSCRLSTPVSSPLSGRRRARAHCRRGGPAHPSRPRRSRGGVTEDPRELVMTGGHTVGCRRKTFRGVTHDTVRHLPLPAGATAKVTGEWAVWSDFNAVNEHALHLAELVSGVPTIVLLFVAFGSAVAAGLPLLLAHHGRWRSA
ncbi:MAG: MMPL family transporter [Acidimicrobiales bacterium]